MKTQITLFSLLLITLISCEKKEFEIKEPTLDIRYEEKYSTSYQSGAEDTLLSLIIVEEYITDPDFDKWMLNYEESPLKVAVETQGGDTEFYILEEGFFGGFNTSVVSNDGKSYYNLEHNLFIPVKLGAENIPQNNMVEIKSFDTDKISISYTSQFTGLNIKREF